jgi:hypothetical protein
MSSRLQGAVTIRTGRAGFASWAPAAFIALAAACGGTTSTTTPPVPVKLQFLTQPVSTTATNMMIPAPRVALMDERNQIVQSAAGVVTISLATNRTGAPLLGTTTAPVVQGIATFSDLQIQRAGFAYSLAASSGDLTGATSAQFDITAGSPAKLVFTTEPTNVIAGAVMSPDVQVTVQDAVGNATSGIPSIAIALGVNPGEAFLTGHVSAAAAGEGPVTFANLALDKAGSGYRLTAAVPSMPDVLLGISSAFNVANAAAASLQFLVQPSNVRAGVPMTPAIQVEVRDAFGNLVTKGAPPLTMTLFDDLGHPTSLGAVTPVNGIATFSNIIVNVPGSYYSLSVSAPPTLPYGVASMEFNVTP